MATCHVTFGHRYAREAYPVDVQAARAALDTIESALKATRGAS